MNPVYLCLITYTLGQAIGILAGIFIGKYLTIMVLS